MHLIAILFLIAMLASLVTMFWNVTSALFDGNDLDYEQQRALRKKTLVRLIAYIICFIAAIISFNYAIPKTEPHVGPKVEKVSPEHPKCDMNVCGDE